MDLEKAGISAYKDKYKGKIKDWGDWSAAMTDLFGAAHKINRWTWFQDPSKQLAAQIHKTEKLTELGADLAQAADGSYFIETITPGTTAASSSFQEGDPIISINGDILKGMPEDKVEDLLSGPENNILHIVSMQDGQRVEDDYTLHKLDKEQLKSTVKLIGKNIAYVKQMTFLSEELQGKLLQELEGMDAKVPGGVQTVILDLRYNGGGLVDLAHELIEEFWDQGVVLHQKKRSESGLGLEDSTFTLTPMPKIMQGTNSLARVGALKDLKRVPLLILVNPSTVSAPEIVGEGLAEARPNTWVFGMPSFGKGYDMAVMDLPDCGKLAITAGIFKPGSDKWLQNRGVVPDHLVKQPRGKKDDAQLAAAVAFAEKQTVLNGANVANMTSEEQKVLGPPAEKPVIPKATTFQQMWAEYRDIAPAFGAGLLSMLILVAFFFASRRKPEEQDDD
jgi:C-terminal processing protease CtpA/Prc